MHSLSFRPQNEDEEGEAKSIGSYAPDRRGVARRGLISLLKLPRTTEHPNRFIAPLEYNRLPEKRTRGGRMVGQLSSCLLLQRRRISDRGRSWTEQDPVTPPCRVYGRNARHSRYFHRWKAPLVSSVSYPLLDTFFLLSLSLSLLPSFFLSFSSPGRRTYAAVLQRRNRKNDKFILHLGGGRGKRKKVFTRFVPALANPEFNRRHVFHCLAPAKQSIRSEILPIRLE